MKVDYNYTHIFLLIRMYRQWKGVSSVTSLPVLPSISAEVISGRVSLSADTWSSRNQKELTQLSDEFVRKSDNEQTTWNQHNSLYCETSGDVNEMTEVPIESKNNENLSNEQNYNQLQPYEENMPTQTNQLRTNSKGQPPKPVNVAKTTIDMKFPQFSSFSSFSSPPSKVIFRPGGRRTKPVVASNENSKAVLGENLEEHTDTRDANVYRKGDREDMYPAMVPGPIKQTQRHHGNSRGLMDNMLSDENGKFGIRSITLQRPEDRWGNPLTGKRAVQHKVKPSPRRICSNKPKFAESPELIPTHSEATERDKYRMPSNKIPTVLRFTTTQSEVCLIASNDSCPVNNEDSMMDLLREGMESPLKNSRYDYFYSNLLP